MGGLGTSRSGKGGRIVLLLESFGKSEYFKYSNSYEVSDSSKNFSFFKIDISPINKKIVDTPHDVSTSFILTLD